MTSKGVPATLERIATREQTRRAPHILVLDQLAAVMRALNAGEDPLPPFEGLSALVEPMADHDPEFPRFWDELDQADFVVERIEDLTGLCDNDAFVRAHLGAYAGLMDRVGIRLRPETRASAR